jgi:hypothetical protein
MIERETCVRAQTQQEMTSHCYNCVTYKAQHEMASHCYSCTMYLYDKKYNNKKNTKWRHNCVALRT